MNYTLRDGLSELLDAASDGIGSDAGKEVAARLLSWQVRSYCLEKRMKRLEASSRSLLGPAQEAVACRLGASRRPLLGRGLAGCLQRSVDDMLKLLGLLPRNDLMLEAGVLQNARRALLASGSGPARLGPGPPYLVAAGNERQFRLFLDWFRHFPERGRFVYLTPGALRGRLYNDIFRVGTFHRRPDADQLWEEALNSLGDWL